MVTVSSSPLTGCILSPEFDICINHIVCQKPDLSRSSSALITLACSYTSPRPQIVSAVPDSSSVSASHEGQLKSGPAFAEWFLRCIKCAAEISSLLGRYMDRGRRIGRLRSLTGHPSFFPSH